MAIVAAVLFFALVVLGLALAALGFAYVRVWKPRLEAAAESRPPSEVPADSLATFVEQLQELARLRDQGILTSREFTAKKTQLLERI
jgi:hypothetical protein